MSNVIELSKSPYAWCTAEGRTNATYILVGVSGEYIACSFCGTVYFPVTEAQKMVLAWLRKRKLK